MLTRFLTMDLLSEGKWIRWSHPKYQFDKITKNEPRKIITWPKTQRDTTKNTSHLCHTSKFVRKGQETFYNDEIGHRSRDLVTQAVTLSHEISSCIKRYCETYRIWSRKIREGQLYLEDEAKYIEYSRAANRITGKYISDRL